MAIEGVIFDVDGTVVRGDEPIPGAADGLAAVETRGLKRVFCSNNPTKPPAAYESRFANAGFAVDRSEVFTAGTVTTAYLEEHHAMDDLFVIGQPGLKTQLEAAGLTLIPDPAAADVLVVSLDKSFSYQSLCDAIVALNDPDTTFLGTDPDTTIPAADYEKPGSGAMIRAIEGVTDRSVSVICGKPSPYARQRALESLGVAADSCLVVGDRLNTDIKLGVDAGMTTAVVMTGITDEPTLAASDIEPDYVLESVGTVESVLDAES